MSKTWRLWSHNLHYRKENRRPALQDALNHQADVVVWIESRPEDAEILSRHWPFGAGHNDAPGGPYGLRIASRFPILEEKTLLSENGEPAVRVCLELPDGRVDLTGLHLHPTLPHAGWRQVIRSFGIRRRQILHLREQETAGSALQIYVGDFNTVPFWLGDLRRFQDFRDEVAAHQNAEATYFYGLPLRIDHLLCRGRASLSAKVVRTLYSDHHALLAEWALGESG